MNKNLVTSLELSRELKEIGVKQNSEFYWRRHWTKNETDNLSIDYDKGKEVKYEDWGIEFISAFLSGELGEMLPWSLSVNEKKWICLGLTEKQIKSVLKKKTNNDKLDFRLICDRGKKFSCFYMEDWDSGCCIFNQTGNQAKTEAEARGKMLVYLIKNGLIKITNNRK